MGIKKDKSLSTQAADLRRHAEEQSRAKTAKLHPSRTEETTERPAHGIEVQQIELEAQNAELRRAQEELETQQVELEIQNEELLRAREELELSRNKYAELYDFAPVGYFTFDLRGVIREVNLTGAQLLGIERRLLANKPFISFIVDADGREIFSSHLKSVLQRQGMQKCEIRLTGKAGKVIYGQLQSVGGGRWRK